MARNDPVQAKWAVGLVIAAVVVALLARLAAPNGAQLGRRSYLADSLMVVSTVALAVGVIWSVSLMIDIIETNDRPSITAQVTRNEAGDATLTGTAVATGLSTKDHAYVRVVAFVGERQAREVNYSIVGPDPDGKVDHGFSILLDQDVLSVTLIVSTSDDFEVCQTPPPGDPAVIDGVEVPGLRDTFGCAQVDVPLPPPTPEPEPSTTATSTT